MALAVTDPFIRLPPELRVQVLVSTGCKASISRIIQASPTMLQQYVAHKKSILRQVLAAEFDPEMRQDAMAILLFPSRRSSGDKHQHKHLCRAHMLAWSKSQLPDPFRGNDDHLVGQLNKLHDQILLFVEDYVTKATASLPPQEYLCLPEIQRPSTEGHLLFKGLKVTPRFSSSNLTSSERRRFVKAFLVFDLLCKNNTFAYIPSKRSLREISNAEYEAVGCVHSYICSLYGAMLAQCNHADLAAEFDPISFTMKASCPIPDTLFFNANVFAPNLRLLSRDFCEDIGAGFSMLGLDRLADFLGYDMAKPNERKALDKKLQDIWKFGSPSIFDTWESYLRALLSTKRKYKNGYESSLYKLLSLKPKEKLRYKLAQERAWVFFDDNRFYLQESTEQQTFPSETFLAEQSAKKTFINDWFDNLRDGKD
ncbi:uncharacterized protein FPRN_12341 [Fusarium proliferatum]|uniref:Uncharacterized protein n=1 Tax=Gibberella intermedia TaxID=948311 RepID=A0A420SEI1_GIBIN|nr:hypothetical protein BFJ72_g13035 [Fusarium proliferatum]CVK96388.1 uncharacterized protein FPRN_12341 [Fusarium proliferatum]